MSTTKLVLADASEITLESGAAIGCMKTHYPDRRAMLSDWERLTPENLKEVQIKADDAVISCHDGLILESETSVLNADGTVDTVWAIREKTENERLRDEIEALKEGQAVQDGAIEDLGAMTSALAEQQEGGKA